jgi:hypothetical protein
MNASYLERGEGMGVVVGSGEGVDRREGEGGWGTGSE